MPKKKKKKSVSGIRTRTQKAAFMAQLLALRALIYSIM
jgi:hypothetical protein